MRRLLAPCLLLLPMLAAARATPTHVPIVGRVQLRDRVLDLTRDSVSSEGSAHEVGQGTAVLADIDLPAQARDPGR